MSASREHHVTFWRHLAEALTAGKAMVTCLNEAATKLAGTDFAGIAAAIVRGLEDGQTLSQAMGHFPDVFDDAIVAAVKAGESAGVLDAACARIADALEADDLASLAESVPGAAAMAEDQDVVAYVTALIKEAIGARASDIHIDCGEGGTGHVRLRIDGVLREQPAPPEGMLLRAVSRFKIMAALDVAERRLPQDGRILLQIDGESYDLRVSVVPACFGERVVARILARRRVQLELSKLGLADEDDRKIRGLCRLPSGMVIVTGPTGSGKTTLLYSMLMEIRDPGVCVLTVEDPVEYTFDGIGQIQIRPAIGLTFARAIRSVLRQDPDVVLVGELRDLEMMQLCSQVALTGHLLLTTLHADTAAGAVQRLIDCGVEPFLVNSAVKATISQRLIRKLCPKCRRPAEPALHSVPPRPRKSSPASRTRSSTGRRGATTVAAGAIAGARPSTRS